MKIKKKTSYQYIKKIADFYHKYQRLPSYREILTITGLRSTNTAHYLVNKLIQRNYLKRDALGKLTPAKKILGNIKLLGTIEAGFPSPAEEELIDTMTLDEYLINNREATFMLKVSGDSMIEAGIMPGDMVLVERGLTPKNGDIVIAEVDGAWTIKFFKKYPNGKVELIPGNKKYKPISPREELKIAAVATAVIRKYI